MKNLNNIVTVLKDFSLSNKFKISITFILVVLFLSFPSVGFSPLGGENFRLIGNIVFPFCHANIFHLCCNLYCLWLLRKPYYIIYGFIISFLCSLLPELTVYGLFTHTPMLPIMGCSGVLFAVIGIKWGMVAKWKEMWRKCWLFFVITAFIPNVAFLFHLYCITVGYAFGYSLLIYRLWQKAKTL